MSGAGKTIRINLHLPRKWDALTTKQMEIVADCVLRAIRQSGPGQYNPLRVKTDIFLRLTGLKVVDVCPYGTFPEEAYFVAVQRPSSWYRKVASFFPGKRHNIPFRIYYWQINQWMEECMSWIESPSGRTVFPYPRYRKKGKTFRGPSTLMQNFTWNQYRIVCDYMDYYVSISNSFVIYARRKDADPKILHRIEKKSKHARNLLLASLFNEEVSISNNVTGRMEKDAPYQHGQAEKNSQYFSGFTDMQMQVVLFWWSGIMGYLKREYSRVFKEGSPSKQQQVNPFKVYTRIIANLEKYLNGMNEKKINEEIYTAVLTHLNDMMIEQERMEKRK